MRNIKKSPNENENSIHLDFEKERSQAKIFDDYINKILEDCQNEIKITKNKQQQEQKTELEKAFNILDLQKRDIDILSQKLEQVISYERKIDELNIQLVEKNKDIKALEHEKNYLNKVLGNIDRIMKIEGQKDQKLQQVHVAYKDEIRMLKERIKELEAIQKQSEKNAMKLHQHYIDLEEKYKQTLQYNNNVPNKTPLKSKSPSQNQLLEQIKNEYEEKIQAQKQKLKEKEKENNSIQYALDMKQSESADMKVQIKEFQTLTQQLQKDKEFIENLNKDLREQLKIQQSNYQEQQTQSDSIDGSELVKIPIKSRQITPIKHQFDINSQSPYKPEISSVKRERTIISASSQQRSTNNSINKRQDGAKNVIKINGRYDQSSNKKEQDSSNLNSYRHSLDIQLNKEGNILKNYQKKNSSAIEEISSKPSSPSTPSKYKISKRQNRSTSINSEIRGRRGTNDKQSEKRDYSGQNYNVPLTKVSNKQSLNQSKIIREDDNLIPEIQQLSGKNKLKDSQEIVQSDKRKRRSIDNKSPNINEQNYLIETPYVKTLNSKYLALKNSSDKSTVLPEQSSSISRKQRNNISSQNGKGQIIKNKNSNATLNDNEQKQKNNMQMNNQYPSDVSEFDLNNTFVEFQKQVSQQGIKKHLQDYEETENSKQRKGYLQIKDENETINNQHNSLNRETIQSSNLTLNKSNYEYQNGKLLSIGTISPHNQISFSDKDYFAITNNKNNQTTIKKIVGGRFWIFKQTNKIMGLQIQYLTIQNKIVWGPTNVHIFTQNVQIQYFSLAQNLQQNDDYLNIDYISMIGCRQNNQYSYIENIIFISNKGIVFSFGKSTNDHSNPIIYFEIDALKEVPFSIFGAISKEYDPMSGILIGTKLSNFGCQVQQFDQKNNSPTKEEQLYLSDNKQRELHQIIITNENNEQQLITNQGNIQLNQCINDPNKINDKEIIHQLTNFENETIQKSNNDGTPQQNQQKEIANSNIKKLDPNLQRILNQYK